MSNIVVTHLTKDYGSNKGIFDLNFSVNKGEVFGYLGPNGAGKSTTIRHLLGFLAPDKGSCTIGGLNCRKDAETIERTLGYLPGEIAFFDDMTGNDYLKFIASMRHLLDLSKMKELIDFFEFDPTGRIKRMSKGMKQKLGLVSAFMHNPETLILDEPTSGLDPLMQSKFIELINKEKTDGKTILMSSHSFEEIEKTCDRVGIIKSGRFIADAKTEELISQKKKSYNIVFKTEQDAATFVLSCKNDKQDIKIDKVTERSVKISLRGDINCLIRALSSFHITALDEIKLNLEDVFMGYYGGTSNE